MFRKHYPAQGLGENYNVKTNETRLSQDTTTTNERTNERKLRLKIRYGSFTILSSAAIFSFFNEAR